jgi:hypothetical protein
MRTIAMLLFGIILAGPAIAQDSTPARDTVIKLKVPKAPRRPDVITRAEIEQVRNEARNAYDVVSRLRAHFLKNRVRGDNIGQANWGKGPQVVLDDSPYGGLENLRNIEIDAIEEIRYLSGPDAAVRFGPDFHGGAILVFTHH